MHFWSIEFTLEEEVSSEQIEILEKMKEILEKLLESKIHLKIIENKFTVAIEWNETQLGNS